MEIIKHLFDFIIHIDTHLAAIIHDVGPWSYLLLFAIIFGETGLVVVPFLPGDSLLFAAGAFAAAGAFNVTGLFFLLLAAAVLGNVAPPGSVRSGLAVRRKPVACRAGRPASHSARSATCGMNAFASPPPRVRS